MPYYHIDNDLSKAQNIDSDLNWFFMDYFHQLIDDDKDWIIAVFLSIYQNWPIYDKIHW